MSVRVERAGSVPKETSGETGEPSGAHFTIDSPGSDAPVTGAPPQSSGAASAETVAAQHPNQYYNPTCPPVVYGIGIIIVYLIFGILERGSFLAFLLALLPTAGFLLIWRFSSFFHHISFESLLYSYGWAFLVGSLAALIYQALLLFVLAMFFFSFGLFTYSGYFVLYFFYSYFGEALASECAKFHLATKARRERPDMTSTHSYLFFTAAAGLGFSTCLVIMQQLVVETSLGDRVAYTMIRVCLEIPLHVLSAIYIGIAVAKREIYQIRRKWYRILLFPIVVKGTLEFLFVIYAATLFWNDHTDSYYGVAITTYVVAVFLYAGYDYYLWRKLPSSFGLLSDNEHDASPQPHTAFNQDPQQQAQEEEDNPYDV